MHHLSFTGMVIVMNIDDLLKATLQQNASDLHLAGKTSALIRVDGELQPLGDSEDKLSQADLEEALNRTTNEKQRKIFEKNLQLDYSYAIKNVGRFRVNAYRDSNGTAFAFRPIPKHAPTFEDLALNDVFEGLCELDSGLVLITGPTGCGKSTTLAAMINKINEKQHKHILTIEDPIEFVYTNNNCLINQRELGHDTLSFNDALRAALREDPDIILVGEMRDIETIRLALTAAETGHLVFATLHTDSAPKTINRIVDVFPGEEKELVRTMLSESLVAVITQKLLKKESSGRASAREIMLCTPAIRNLIRENKIPQIYSAIQTGQSMGMQTMQQAISALVENGEVNATYKEAE